VLQLLGTILAEQHEELQSRKRWVNAESIAKLTAAGEEGAPPLPIAS
jgi:hypothetical protein